MTYAKSGWLGHITFVEKTTGTRHAIRFNDETINIPLGVRKSTNIHAGQRNSGLYSYQIVAPSGSISFPLMTQDISNGTENRAFLYPSNVNNGGNIGSSVLDDTTKYLLNLAVKPQLSAGYPPTDMPYMTGVELFRGDLFKILSDTYVNGVTISSNVDSDVACSIDLRSIFGYRQAVGSSGRTAPTVSFGIARSVHFNELLWSDYANMILQYFDGASVPNSFLPRDFSITVNNNLQPDSSYNHTNPQALHGFTLGEQDVSASITLVGGFTASSTDMLMTNVSIGGIYTIPYAIWTAVSTPIPGPSDIAVTSLSMEGLAAGITSITAGALIS